MSYRGIGNPSQMVDGLGNPSQMVDGLGAINLNCPPTNSTAMPAGLSPSFLASYPLTSNNLRKTTCNFTDPVSKLCDLSALPSLCAYAKNNYVDGQPTKSFLGRASTQNDWKLWYDWTPGGAASEGTPGGSAEDNTMLYVAAAVGAALIIGGVWYATR